MKLANPPGPFFVAQGVVMHMKNGAYRCLARSKVTLRWRWTLLDEKDFAPEEWAQITTAAKEEP